MFSSIQEKYMNIKVIGKQNTSPKKPNYNKFFIIVKHKRIKIKYKIKSSII